MATSPIWVMHEAVISIHKRQIAEHGGGTGIRDIGLLESALAKPKNAFSYSDEQLSIPSLASDYANGIARNHPFVDGNTRTSLIISLLFLELNNWELLCDAENLYGTFIKLADGSLSANDLSAWFKKHSKKKT
jgi:death-on-curing protein